MSTAMWDYLLRLEMEADAECVFLHRQAQLLSAPVHAACLAPEHLPVLPVWLRACAKLRHLGVEGAVELRAVVEAERLALGVDPATLLVNSRLLLNLLLQFAARLDVVPDALDELLEFRVAFGQDWPLEAGTATESAFAQRLNIYAGTVASVMEGVFRDRCHKEWLALMAPSRAMVNAALGDDMVRALESLLMRGPALQGGGTRSRGRGVAKPRAKAKAASPKVAATVKGEARPKAKTVARACSSGLHATGV